MKSISALEFQWFSVNTSIILKHQLRKFTSIVEMKYNKLNLNFPSRQITESHSLAETKSWSPHLISLSLSSSNSSCHGSSVVGFEGGLCVGFDGGLCVGFDGGLSVGFSVGLVVGLCVGFSVGLVVGLAVGL